MASRPSALQPLSAEEKLLIKSWLLEFSQTWTADRLAERIAILPPQGDRLRLPTLIELIKHDLRRRWEQGDRVEVESYLASHPELGTPDAAPIGLVRAELEAREKAGTAAPLDEIRSRFPRQANQLEQQRAGAATILPLAPANRETMAPEAPETPAAIHPEMRSSTPPERIGRYKIIRQIGQGGMGKVYLAHDEQLDRDVALKVPKFDPDEGPHVRERFYREARAAAALHHPNVCAIYEIAEIDGVPLLVMAYVEGRQLSEYIDRGRGVNPQQAAILIRKLALALKEAHRQGIVHRDLKPSNIMIDQRKEPVIMDFGLARLERHEASRLTKLGAILGTPQYMPPEQVAGNLDAVAPSCDIYSLGIILYELLAGRTPFTGPPALILGLVLTQNSPPPSQFRPDLDGEIEAICMKAIARRPEDRYASMDELATALHTYIKKVSQGQPLQAASLPVPVAQVAPVAAHAPLAREVPVAQVAPEAPAGIPAPEPIELDDPDEAGKITISAPLIVVAAGVVLAFLFTIVWFLTRPEKNPDELPPRDPPPIALGPRLHLQPVRGVILDPGGKDLLLVAVFRDNCSGPIRIELDGLPPSITADRVAFIPADRGFTLLELLADQQAEAGIFNFKVVALLDEQRAEAWTTVSIKPRSSPPIGPGSIELVLDRKDMGVMQGRSATWTVGVRRQNYSGPVTISLKGLPKDIACTPIRLEAEELVASLKVIAAVDAPLEESDLTIEAVAGPLATEEKVKLTVRLQQSIKVLPVDAVALHPGEKTEFEIPISRQDCEGAVEVRLEGLPEFVIGGKPTLIQAEENKARFMLFATNIATPETRKVRILARLGDAIGEGTMTVTIEPRRRRN
jgi:predicted Ser/Thr protein kinase